MDKRCNLSILAAMALAVVMLIPAGTAAAADLTVETAAVCENVVEHEPVNAAASFPATVNRLYCFTKIVGAQEPTEIAHVWYWGDVERARVMLNVKAASWRTYSSKVIQEHEIGPWRVDIVDAAGTVLGTVNFEVTQ
jgi:hypothetical protein